MNDQMYEIVILLLLVLVVVFVLAKVVGAADKALTAYLHQVRDRSSRDVKRVYLKSEKDAAMAMCGWRCEGTRILWRCRHHGDDLQGDHWYPHARGGATTQANLVMLCPRCNRKKSAHIPTRLQSKALERRRRKYTSESIASPGEWLPKHYQVRIASPRIRVEQQGRYQW